MKNLYFVLLFLVCSFGFSQEIQTKTDIEGLRLYPNPVTTNKIYISTAKNAAKHIIIFDVLGTKVMETTILGKELNLSNLDKGVYILRVIEKDKMATRKLIIK